MCLKHCRSFQDLPSSPDGQYFIVLYSVYRAGATGTAMTVPTSQNVGPRGPSKPGEKKSRCMILYRESPRVQDLPSNFQKTSGDDPLKDGPSAAPLHGSCLRPWCIHVCVCVCVLGGGGGGGGGEEGGDGYSSSPCQCGKSLALDKKNIARTCTDCIVYTYRQLGKENMKINL